MRHIFSIIWTALQVIWVIIVLMFQAIRDKIASKIGRFWTYMIFATTTWLPVMFMPVHNLWQGLICVVIFLLWLYGVSLGAHWASRANFDKMLQNKVNEALNTIICEDSTRSATNS